MNTAKNRRLFVEQLDEYLTILEKATVALSYSYDKCRAIGKKNEYDLEEQESFEALTARFARTSDILTQKVIKSMFILLHENIKTIIDAARFLEKLEIIENANDLLNIREIRNQIAHEYVEPDIKELFFDVLRYVPELKKIIKSVKIYRQEHIVSP